MTEVVAALIWNGGKFLICRRPPQKARGNLWEFVGGKVESGETGEQALIRECREELAIVLRVGEKFMDTICIPSSASTVMNCLNCLAV